MWAHDTPAVRVWVWFRVKVRNIEFKKRRRRRRGQRRLKNELIFYLRISRFSKVIILFLAVQAISKLHTEYSVKLDMEIQNISRHRSHYPDNPKFGHFTLWFCRGRRDWSEKAHYISLRHAPYVTRVHCWDIMHAAYVIGTSARNSRYIL